jgi:peptide/nickel transport system substrate-binding protein
MTLAVTDDPGNLDPSMTVLSVTRFASDLAYDTLVNQDPTGKFISGLADSWKINPDGVTLTLHKGVTCSDGTTLTATDVKGNIDFVSDPKNKSPLTGVIVPPGLTTTANDAAGTVTIKTPAPDAFLLNQLAGLFIVCKAGLANHASLAQKTIGTGPWVLSQAVANDHYTYTLNPNYNWAPGGGPMTGPGIPATVTLRVIANQSTTANLLLSGEVNMAVVTGSDVDRLTAAGLKTLDTRSPLGETFFNENTGRPGADPQVRLALATGSDMNSLMKVATSGRGSASTGLVTIDPKPCGQDTVTGNVPAFDVNKAKSILDADGWVPGSDGIRAKGGKKLTIKFIYGQSGGDALAAAAELLAEEWKALGAQVTPSVITSTQLNTVLFASGDWDAGWIPITVNLPSQLVGFLSGPAPATNFAHLNNATYNTDSTKAASTGQLAAACALWNSAEISLFKASDVVPMFDTIGSYFLKNATAAISGGELVGSSLRLTS